MPLMMNKMNRCCCAGTPPIDVFWLYGGLTAERDYSSGLFIEGTPGIVAVSDYTHVRNEDVAIRPWGLVYFPIMANPGQVIANARFELTLASPLGGLMDLVTGKLSPVSRAISQSELPGTSQASWQAVASWPTGAPMYYLYGPILTGMTDTEVFDVTAIVQAIINAANFARGASFAAIIECDLTVDPTGTYSNSGLLNGFWTDGTPQPNTGVVQCELIIT